MELDCINGQVMVVGFHGRRAEQCGLQKGDILLEVDDKSINDRIEEKKPYFARSTKNYSGGLLYHVISTDAVFLKVKCLRGEKQIEVSVKGFSVQWDIPSPRTLNGYKFLTSDIGYFYPHELDLATIPDMIESFRHTRGVVIDMRGYPKEVMTDEIARWLLPDSVRSAAGTFMDGRFPGAFKKIEAGVLPNVCPDRYKGKVVILVNNVTISQSEYVTMVWQNAPDCVVIGSQTQGADGRTCRLPLPGGFRSSFTGNGMYYPDWRETQRVGVSIDEVIYPTSAGVLKP